MRVLFLLAFRSCLASIVDANGDAQSEYFAYLFPCFDAYNLLLAQFTSVRRVPCPCATSECRCEEQGLAGTTYLPAGHTGGEGGLGLAQPGVVVSADGRADDQHIAALASKRSFESVDYDEQGVTEGCDMRATMSSAGASTSADDDGTCGFSLERDVEETPTVDGSLKGGHRLSRSTLDVPAAFEGLSASAMGPPTGASGDFEKGNIDSSTATGVYYLPVMNSGRGIGQRKAESGAFPRVSRAPALVSSGAVSIWQGGERGEGKNASTSNETARMVKRSHAAGVDPPGTESAVASHGRSLLGQQPLQYAACSEKIALLPRERIAESSEIKPASRGQPATGRGEERTSSSSRDSPGGIVRKCSSNARTLVSDAAIRRPIPGSTMKDAMSGRQSTESFECHRDGHHGSESKANSKPNAGICGLFPFENLTGAEDADRQTTPGSRDETNSETGVDDGSSDDVSSDDEQFNPSVSSLYCTPHGSEDTRSHRSHFSRRLSSVGVVLHARNWSQESGIARRLTSTGRATPPSL